MYHGRRVLLGDGHPNWKIGFPLMGILNPTIGMMTWWFCLIFFWISVSIDGFLKFGWNSKSVLYDMRVEQPGICNIYIYVYTSKLYVYIYCCIYIYVTNQMNNQVLCCSCLKMNLILGVHKKPLYLRKSSRKPIGPQLQFRNSWRWPE